MARSIQIYRKEAEQLIDLIEASYSPELAEFALMLAVEFGMIKPENEAKSQTDSKQT